MNSAPQEYEHLRRLQHREAELKAAIAAESVRFEGIHCCCDELKTLISRTTMLKVFLDVMREHNKVTSELYRPGED